MLNMDIIFYISTFFSIVTILFHMILKCKYNNNYLDQYIYLDDNGNIYKYIFTRVITSFISGVIFSNKQMIITLINTIVIETLLVVAKNCNIHEINNMKFAFVSIVISISFFYIGGIFNPYVFGTSK